MPRSKSKSKKAKKSDVNETKAHAIKEKSYITKQIETSITLLESPESSIVLESLLFLSKYADIQKNNLVYIHSRGLLPKLLALFDHNICIVRVSLRLLSQLLTVEAAQVELNQEKFDKAIMKICNFYISHGDVNVKEFSILILAAYSVMGRTDILLEEPGLVGAILKTVKKPETELILNKTLELFSRFLEVEKVRKTLPQEKDFSLQLFVQHMHDSKSSFLVILNIFEKMTYFGEDVLQNKLKECCLVEHMFDIIVDPERAEYAPTCLNIVLHCMKNENTNSYFTTSLEFLKFSQWGRKCPLDFLHACAQIFLELSKIDAIKQMLFDLSIEDTILSFFRCHDKKILNATCEAICHMSKHKYCCEKMVTPVVIQKLLQIMQRTGDGDDPQNETALSTLHYFSKRDSRTIHMIAAYDGLAIMLRYLQEGTVKLPEYSYKKVLEMINMFVTNNQLQSLILSPDLYDVILAQTLSKFDEICMRSLEIMINCLNHKDFQNYFLLNKGSQVVTSKLTTTTNEQVVRLLIIFVHNALLYDNLAKDLVYAKILLILKTIPEGMKYRNPLIQRVINMIYDMCLPIKFFETGKLDLMDKFTERFYVICGPWTDPFPFLEVLELRMMSTLSTIYVIDDCVRTREEKGHDCFSLQMQNRGSNSLKSMSSIDSVQTKCSINFGRLSHDPFLPKYIREVKKLISKEPNFKEKIRVLAEFVDSRLCGPEKDSTTLDKQHTFKLHIECIKQKLGTNMIPIGYLRLGFQCEKALLFKALADYVDIPVTFVKGKNKIYWNEVALIETVHRKNVLKMFVVDLMNKIGQLLLVGSRQCNTYCDIQ